MKHKEAAPQTSDNFGNEKGCGGDNVTCEVKLLPLAQCVPHGKPLKNKMRNVYTLKTECIYCARARACVCACCLCVCVTWRSGQLSEVVQQKYTYLLCQVASVLIAAEHQAEVGQVKHRQKRKQPVDHVNPNSILLTNQKTKITIVCSIIKGRRKRPASFQTICLQQHQALFVDFLSMRKRREWSSNLRRERLASLTV